MKKSGLISLFLSLTFTACTVCALAACGSDDNKEPVTYTVTYSLGDYDGTGSAPAAQTAEENTKITLPAVGVTWTDHTFLGWKDSADGNALAAGTEYTVTANVTLTASWEKNAPEPDGSLAHPYVLDTFAGAHEFVLPDSTSDASASIFCLYTAEKTAIYSVSATLNGAAFSDLNLIIAESDDVLNGTVAVWDKKSDSYDFPLFEGTTYRIQLGDHSAAGTGGTLVFTATEKAFSIITAYQDEFSNTGYAAVIDSTSITINDIPATDIYLAPRNDGYTFQWDGKDCLLSLAKTQMGGYTDEMLFIFGDGEEDSITLYRDGNIPAPDIGSEETPEEIAQSELAKAWDVSLSMGPHFYTFTADEDKTYTLTTDVDYLTFVLTDANGKKLVNWNDSLSVKEAVFAVKADVTYSFYVSDSEAEFTYRNAQFTIVEGGEFRLAVRDIEEILNIEWAGQAAGNSISLTASTVSVTVVKSPFTFHYSGDVVSVEQTATGYDITFDYDGTKYTLSYDSTAKTLNFITAGGTYLFVEKASEGGWEGALPAKWNGTWTSQAGTIAIDGNDITVTVGDLDGVKVTITAYDAATETISFKTEGGASGTIQNAFSWAVGGDTIDAINIVISGTTYSNFRK